MPTFFTAALQIFLFFKIFSFFLNANTDPENVFFEMDVYWTVVGGQSPVEYMQKYPGRLR